MGVPNVFGSATTSIPLSQLDANFNTGLTIGNTTIGLGNTTTTLGNVILTNATISSPSGIAANVVIYANTSGNLTGNANLTFDGATLTSRNLNGTAVKAYYNDGRTTYASLNYDGVSSTGATPLNFASGTSTTFSVNTNASTVSNALFISTAGYVGVGTASPATNLVVSGSGGRTLQVTNTTLGEAASDGTIFQVATNGTAYLYNQENAAMIFGTNNIEAMRIDASGNLLVGATAVYRTGQSRIKTTSIQSALLLETTGATVASGVLEISAASAPSNTSNFLIVAATGGADKFYVYTNGNVVNVNNSYGALSDQSIKENIVDATPKLDDLMQVKICNYNLINDENKIKQIGVVAQELEQVFPLMVDIDGKSGLKQVKYSVFVPILIKAIQELNAKVTTLEAQLGAK